MDAMTVERILGECDAALERERKPDLTRTGFWKAVAAVKRQPQLRERYADRIAQVERETFLRRTPIVMPAWTGVALETLGTAVSAAIVAAAPALASPWRELAFLVGTGGLIGMTHALTHYVVGGLMGIRFTHFFSVPPLRPQPGFKTDYATYLRTPPRSRAWMHASGAIVSKIVPFLVAVLAAAGGAQPWAVYALLAIGVLQLFTDATLSTRASDWKRFKREMRFAR